MEIIKNPDAEFAAELRADIRRNGGYCISKFERNKNTKCMCRAFKEQEEGICDCGLYIKIKETEE